MKNKANATIGDTVRRLRESAKFSQEKLAEKAGITYQYLSSIENGKENFSIGVLDSIANALGLGLDALVAEAYSDDRPVPTVRHECFVKNAVLPPRLTGKHVEAVLNRTHGIMRTVNASLMKSTGRPLSSFIQGNNFSGIVSNILTDTFSALTPYKNFHGQRYPDLVLEGEDETACGLEVKATVQIGKGGESHNGHSGWHVVACFRILEGSGDIQFIHVMFANLNGAAAKAPDWKYVGSKVNKQTGSQRTETYNTTSAGTAKLRHGTAYLDDSVVNISKWKIDPSVAVPVHSPFAANRRKAPAQPAPNRPVSAAP
ncbi:MAG: helix-turn-helix domain-containing protein [Candidatus Accumulibacter sp.]|nr:helix-turn-helix domain-containing protein [Accumulibacter sp.]